MHKCNGAWILVAMLSVCGALAPAAHATEAATRASDLDRLVKDVCAKPVVLLGEDANHGGGRTLDVKVRLVRRLVDECGFSAVFFESPLYDFVDLSHAYETDTASPERLADALGGLWSTAAEVDPLVSYLHRNAATGTLRLAGLGPGLGESTALYARKRLPGELVRELPEPRRGECKTALLRYGSWEYDDDHPYGTAVEAELKACARDIDDSFAGRRGAAADEARFMASNVSLHFAMSAEGGGDSWAQRDRAMADNFFWLRARLPKRTKVIVWCATVHAAKQLPPGAKRRNSMGSYLHRALGDEMAAIGFSALSGRIAPVGRPPLELPALSPESVERRAFAHAQGDLRYLDRKQLHALGVAPARPLDQTGVQQADWSTIVDGLLVLREEQPVRRLRAAKPQQAQ